MIEVKFSFDNPEQALAFFTKQVGSPAPVVSVDTAKPAEIPAAAEKPVEEKVEAKKTGRPKKDAAPAAAKAVEPVTEPEGGWTKDHAKGAMEKVLNHFTANPEQVDGKPVPALDSLKKWCMANPSPDSPFVSVSKVAEAGRIGDFVAAANALAGV